MPSLDNPEIMEKVSALSAWENYIKNMGTFQMPAGVAVENGKTDNKYYRFMALVNYKVLGVCDKQNKWFTNQENPIPYNWVWNAIKVHDGKRDGLPFPSINQEHPDFADNKEQVYNNFLPIYRALKESFDNRSFWQFIFNHRQYTAERDALKAIKTLILNTTGDKEADLNARYEQFKTDIPTSNVTKLKAVFESRDKNKKEVEKFKQIEERQKLYIKEEEENLIIVNNIETEKKNQLDALKQKMKTDFKSLTNHEKYIIVSSDEKEMESLQSTIIKNMGNPSKKALFNIIGTSVRKAALEGAEKTCLEGNNYNEFVSATAQEIFINVFQKIATLSYNSLKEHLIAAQQITDAVLKKAGICAFIPKDFGKYANNYVLQNATEEFAEKIVALNKATQAKYTKEEVLQECKDFANLQAKPKKPNAPKVEFEFNRDLFKIDYRPTIKNIKNDEYTIKTIQDAIYDEKITGKAVKEVFRKNSIKFTQVQVEYKKSEQSALAKLEAKEDDWKLIDSNTESRFSDYDPEKIDFGKDKISVDLQEAKAPISSSVQSKDNPVPVADKK